MKILEPFGVKKPIIGMVHLLPTPLSPKNMGKWEVNTIIDKAVEDARVLAENKLDGVIIENFGDSPFYPDEVPAHTLSTIALAVHAVVKEVEIPVGVNILRNACKQAVAVGAITGASFIRCNVLTGMMLTDQGVINANAHDTIRYRAMLGKDVRVFADVLVKHAYSLLPFENFVDIAQDTVDRGGADAIIITGKRTGMPPSEHMTGMVMALKEARPEIQVIVGSGINPNNLIYLHRNFNGFIVGTYLTEFNKEKGWYDIVPERVKRIREALNE